MTIPAVTTSTPTAARALPRLAWEAAHRAARYGRDGTPHGPEEAAAMSA